MNKRGIIFFLVIINTVLLTAFAITNLGLAPAYAQAAPVSQRYLAVAGEVRDGMDAVYMIDLATRHLHAFLPNREINNRQIFWAGSRDLTRDFRQGG